MPSRMTRTAAALIAAAAAAFAAPTIASAADFTISFEWGDIPLCTSGNPGTVPNPAFKLAGVPNGTKVLRFTLTDLDKPDYDHGGGEVPYSGQSEIAPGTFTYKSPCPPNGAHTYEWEAAAKESDGFFADTLGTAKAQKRYPK